MPDEKKLHTLDDDKTAYLKAFIMHRVADLADLALNGNREAASLFVFYIEQVTGLKADEQNVTDYWQNLRRVEDALMAQGLPA